MPGRVGKDTQLIRQYQYWLGKEKEARARAEAAATEFERLVGKSIDVAIRISQERAERFGWKD